MLIFGQKKKKKGDSSPEEEREKVQQSFVPNSQKTKEVQPWHGTRKHRQWHEEEMAEPSSLKKGGKVKKTGMAKVHKGETVIPAKKKRGKKSACKK